MGTFQKHYGMALGKNKYMMRYSGTQNNGAVMIRISIVVYCKKSKLSEELKTCHLSMVQNRSCWVN